MKTWRPPPSGGYAPDCVHGIHRHEGCDSPRKPPGPPPKTPARVEREEKKAS